MDPVTAAGLGLSVTSLALQVFAGCLKGYQIFAEAADLPAEYQHLRTRLRIEQSRHMNWGEQVGLLEESLDAPSQVLRLHRNLILDVLLEVSAAFASTLSISSKYEEFVPEDTRPLKGVSIKQSRFLERTKRCWQVPGRAVSRLRWATIKHEKFEKLITRLVGYNDSMESILDRSSLKELSVMQERSNLLLLQLTEKVSQLHNLTKALEMKPTFTTTVAQTTLQAAVSTGMIDVGVGLGTLTAFKIENLNIVKDTSGVDMHIAIDRVQLIDDDREQDRSQGRLDNQGIFVEWRTPLDVDTSANDTAIIENRLNQLAFLLSKKNKPPEFRTPHCIGYCRRSDEDDVQYGLVYEIPSPGGTISDVATLRECFREIPPPSLTIRTAVSNAMVESLLYLHAVNWLHKGFRSDNILFYLPDNSTSRSETDLANPMISGFDFSRPDTLDEITVKSTSQARHDYYKHPQLLRQSNIRSQKSYDIYALGIVLIEVSLWRPIEDIMASILRKPLTTSQISRIRERLLSDPFERFPNVIAAVAAQSGTVHAEAVRKCIQGEQSLGIDPNADESDPDVGAALQRAFFDDVYLKIKSLHM